MEALQNLMDRLSQSKLWWTFTAIVMIGIVGFMINLLGIVGFITVYVGFTIAFVIMGSFMLSLAGAAYYGTIWFAKRYVQKLNKAGCQVWLDLNLIKQMAILAMIATIMTPLLYFMGDALYAKYSYHQEMDWNMGGEWWFTVSLMSGCLTLVWALAVYGTVSIWFNSFRPLRRAYLALGRGEDPRKFFSLPEQ